MNLSNYTYNKLGGVDADRELESGEIVPYTLSDDEIAELEGVEIASFDSESHERNIAISNFRAKRQELIDNLVVTISTGKSFDANEKSIQRLTASVVSNLTKPDDFIIEWSTADVGTGIMVDCTKSEIKEALFLATEKATEITRLDNA